MPENRVVAVVLAGGRGERAGATIPKQFVRVAGKPVLQHTLEVFAASPGVTDVLVVCEPAHEPQVRAAAVAAGVALLATCPPGVTRQGSTAAAMSTLEDLGLGDCRVLVHDAVRPLLSPQTVQECVRALDHAPAVDVVIPSADTIVRVDEAGDVLDVPPRHELRRGQTPQGFHLPVLREAYRLLAPQEWASVTDDCAVVRRAFPGVRIATVAGSETNLKITYPSDFLLMDQLIRTRTEPPTRTDPTLPDGMVVVVLGGTRGIGAAVCTQVRALGATAVALGRRTGVDVRDESTVRMTLAAIEARFGRVDAVVVTAGVLIPGDLVEAPWEEITRTVEVNLLGTIASARAAHRQLRRTHGQLVLFTSSSYTRGRAGYAVYSATKAAVVNLAQALSDEWAADGIRVNCVSPGRTATKLRTDAFDDTDDVLDPDRVAEVTVALLAGQHTGAVVDVNPHMLTSAGLHQG